MNKYYITDILKKIRSNLSLVIANIDLFESFLGGWENIIEILRTASNQFSASHPLYLNTGIKLINGEYQFKDNFNDYVEGKESELELKPNGIYSFRGFQTRHFLYERSKSTVIIARSYYSTFRRFSSNVGIPLRYFTDYPVYVPPRVREKLKNDEWNPDIKYEEMKDCFIGFVDNQNSNFNNFLSLVFAEKLMDVKKSAVDDDSNVKYLNHIDDQYNKYKEICKEIKEKSVAFIGRNT